MEGVLGDLALAFIEGLLLVVAGRGMFAGGFLARHFPRLLLLFPYFFFLETGDVYDLLL